MISAIYRSILVSLAVLAVASFSVGVFAAEDTFETRLNVIPDVDNPPTVPTVLTATAVSSTQIDLSWNASIDDYGVVGYRIYRDGVVISSTTLTTFIDSGLTPSTLYTYEVEAFDAVPQYSGVSASASATTLATPVTPTPSGGSSSGGSIITMISDVVVQPGQGGAQVTFATNVAALSRVQWGLTADFELGSMLGFIYTTSHATFIDGLVPGTRYFYRIEATGPTGNVAYIEGSFTTLSPVVDAAPANVSSFRAVPRESDIALSWVNPSQASFDEVRVVRSDKFFPRDIYEGQVVYEGRGQSYVDADVVPGVTYYYAIFVKDSTGRYSSGALAQTRISVAGEPSQPSDPFADIPVIDNVHPMIAGLTLPDFEFYQQGKRLVNSGLPVGIDGSEDLTVRLSYDKVPELLKTIAITLTDPEDPSQVFPFLLRINADKTYYEATIGPLGKSGNYGMSIVILDYKNQGLKKLEGDLRAFVFSTVDDLKVGGMLRSWMFPTILASIALLVFLVLRRRERRQEEVARSTAGVMSILAAFGLAAAVFIAVAPSAFAQFNPNINYQGKLTDMSNTAVPDGLYEMEFNLYTDPEGGSPIWTESLTGADAVQVTNGLFSVMLGSTTPLTGVDFNQTLYLGVTIEDDTEMEPRKVLGAVPAAFVAGTSTVALTAQSAQSLNGVGEGQFFRNDTSNSTSTSSTFLSVIQTGAGKIAEFFGAASKSVLSLLSNGNVGVGTSTPGAKLSIHANNGETNTALFTIASSTSNSTTTLFTVLNNGRVGIGTTTPAYKLTVDGSAGLAGTITTLSEGDIFSQYDGSVSGGTYPIIARYWNDNGTYPASTFIFGNGNNALVGIEKPGGSQVSHFQVRAEKSTFDGSIGIGTTSPYARLSVVGDVVAARYVATTTATSTFGGGINIATGCYAVGGVCLQVGSGLTGSGVAGAMTYWTGDGSLGATTSPTIGYITATSTSGSSSFAHDVSIDGALNIRDLADGFISIGYGNTTDNSSDSIVIGAYNVSDGSLESVAVGSYNTASGDYSSAFGRSNTASEDYSSAFGHGNSALDVSASAFGYANVASGNSSSAFGFGNTATAANASIFGAGITNSISNSTMIGPSDSAKLTILSTGEVRGSFFTATSTSGVNTFPRLVSTNATTTNLAVTGTASTTGFAYFGDDVEIDGSVEIGDNLNVTNGVSADIVSVGTAVVLNANALFLGGYFSGPFVRYDDDGMIGFNAGDEESWVFESGNVGIGTTSPYARLSVVGDVVAARYVATTTATSTFAGGIQTALLNVTGSATSSFANGINLTTGCFAVNGTCLVNNTYGNTDVNAYIHASTTIPKTYTANTFTALQTFANASSTNLSVSGNFYNSSLTSGRVPYVTTGGRLVDSAGFTFNGTTLALNANTSSGALQLRNSDVSSNTAYLGISGFGSPIVSNVTNGDFVLMTDGGSIAFAANGSSVADMYIQGSTGNVGIGTTSPYAKLSVEGDVVASHFTATSTNANRFSGRILTPRLIAGSGAFSIGDVSSSIGVNTTNQAWLDVDTFLESSGSQHGAAVQINSSYVGPKNIIGYGQTVLDYSGGGSSDVSITGLNLSTEVADINGPISYTGGVHNLYSIASSIKILDEISEISGTFNNINMFLRPTVITTIGDATFKNLSIFSGDDSALATGKKLIFESSYPDETNLTLGDSYIMYDGTNASLNFIENGNDSIILKSGNVGIGTTSPFAKLSVEGDVVADSFIGTSAATSTFGGGIDIATGCFAIAGTCIGTGGGGGSSLFTDAGSFTYLTATSNDVIFGGSDTSSAPFWWDVSEAAAYIQGSTPGDSVLQLGADDDAWTFGYSNSDKSFRIASSTALGSDDVFTILKGGNTGIGTTTPWKTLSVDGTFALSSSLSVATVGNYLCINQSTYEVTAGTTCSASSERFKEDINPLSYGLAQVMALNPVSFRYKPTVDPDNSKRLGFIAEEVFEIVPELVALDKEGLPESVDYAKLTPVLVQAIKDLNVRIDDLSALAALAQGTSTNVGGSSGEGGSSSSGLMGNVWSAVKGQMESFGVFFESAYTRITKLFVRELHIEEKLCIDDVCIDKDQLKALIVQAGATPTNTGGSAGDLNNDGDLNQGGDVNGAGDNDGNNDTEPNDGHDDEDGDGSNDDDEGNGANDDDETSQNGAGDDENDSNGSSGDGEDNDGLGNENNSDGASNGGSSDAGDTGDGGDAGNTGGETAGSSGEGNGGSGSEGSGSAGGEGTGGTE